MKSSITRRDFLNGAALALGAGAMLSSRDLLALESATADAGRIGQDYYPPTLTGMRGNHAGSFEVAHAMAWRGEKPTEYAALDETYDLVIVGGGLSGLASAYLYRKQAGADKKILILENHDDFGGHAKRNEFHSDGRMLLGIGGSVNLEQDNFSDDVHTVLKEIGVDLERLDAAREPGHLLAQLGDAQMGYYLNKQTYGKDRVAHGQWIQTWLGQGDVRASIGAFGLPSDQEKRLVALAEGERDLLPELSLWETKRYIETTSYRDFLSQKAGLKPETIALFDPLVRIFYGVGVESCSVAEAFLTGAPGMKSLGLTGSLVSKLFAYMAPSVRFPLFPDGNASIARMLVRRLIPEVAPGSTMDDVVSARFDYSKLDREESPIRLRLNSTVVHAVNHDGGVEVSYVQGGKAYSLRARHCIMACYNGIIPHICPELPEAQKEHLKYGVKVPLVMTNVLLRNSDAVKAAGPVQYVCPGSFYEIVSEAPPVSLGEYRGARQSGPIVLWMAHNPSPQNNGQQTARDLYRLGRHRLYSTPFSTFESAVEQQLTGMFGRHGFDAGRDIEAITVNRWAHGYSYEYTDLYDPDWEDGQAPHELGRKPLGCISIANADSEGSAYLHAAIDAAWRAVGERLSD
ncbi:MAG: NAD(P)-binding protein [Myxococcales bacterium]